MLTVAVAAHPWLELAAFTTELPAPLGELGADASIAAALAADFAAPWPAPDEAVRAAVREVLRHGGFKPKGRSKPAAEYLAAAVAETGRLASINPAVDACNAASLHGGLAVSVLDLDRTRPPLSVALAPDGASYAFNPSGQTIDLGGLVCLFDADGPCANPVKDAQRTKTDATTRRTLTIAWGTRALPGRAAEVAAFVRGLLDRLGAHSADAAVTALG